MIIHCKGCESKYFLPDDKVPQNPVKVRCPRCQAVFQLAAPEHIVAGVGNIVTPRPGRLGDTAPKRARRAAKVSVPRAPKPDSRRGDGHDQRARRLARVLVSDILCYNQEKRDQALADGNLMSVLGDEIKKSWELYKDKVGDEVATSTNYFKEALNEILADGQEVF